MDSVSDRDYAIEFLSACSLLHDAPEPLLRGDHPVVQLGVQVR